MVEGRIQTRIPRARNPQANFKIPSSASNNRTDRFAHIISHEREDELKIDGYTINIIPAYKFLFFRDLGKL